MIELYHQIFLYNLEKIFWNKILKWIYNKITAIDDQIKSETIQYDINREAAKILALSSGKLINMNILQSKKYCLLIKNK